MVGGKNFLGSPPPQAFREFSSTPEFPLTMNGNSGVELNSREARGGELPKKFFSSTIKISPATNTRKRLTSRGFYAPGAFRCIWMHLDAFRCISMHLDAFRCISLIFLCAFRCISPTKLILNVPRWFGLWVGSVLLFENSGLEILYASHIKCLKIRDWKFYMHRHVKRFRVMVAGDIWMGGEKIFWGSPTPRPFRGFSPTPEFPLIMNGNSGVGLNSQEGRGGALPKKNFSPVIKIPPQPLRASVWHADAYIGSNPEFSVPKFSITE